MNRTGLNFKLSATNRASPAMKQVQNSLKGVAVAQRQVAALQPSWNRGLNANRRAVQQFGFQMSDFAIQIAGGQSAMLAFTQQGGQMLQFFGPVGSIMAALLAVFGSLAIAFTKTGKSLSDLFPLMGVLQDEFRGIGRALGVAKEAMIDFANLVVNNLDVILISATLLVAYLTGAWIIAWVRAAGVVGAFNKVLGVTWRLMMRTGIGALVVGLGYLIERFLALSAVVGGMGEAFGLLRDVAVEAFERIAESPQVIVFAIKAASFSMAAWFVEGINKMVGTFMDFTWTVADGLNELFGTNLMGAKLGKTTQELALLAMELRDMAGAASAEMTDAFGAPLQSLEALRAKLAEINEPQVDVRDWFGGGGGDGEGGDASSKAKKDAEEIERTFKDMQEAISASMSESFKSLLKGTMSLADAATKVLDNILDRVFNILMNPLLDAAAGSITSGIFTGLTGLGVPNLKLPSNEGGGFTGYGVRAGGIDGKGGILSINHPNETVVDHQKGDGMGGGGAVVNNYFNISTPDVDGFRKSRRQIEREMSMAARAGSRGG